MYKLFPDNTRRLSFILLTNVTGFVALFFALFFWQGHQGFSLWDEGFLWYGAQRTMVGEVPMRDFIAYDIGRYYWSAAIMSLMDDNGIVALRVASTLFQTISLYIGLAMLVRSSTKQNFLFWLLAALTLVAWMAPQCRLFDISMPIMLVGTLAFLVEQPSGRRYFLTGLVIGLIAVFGRNHALYGVVGSMCAMLYLTIRRERNNSLLMACSMWVIGVVVGYLPVLVFLVLVPGFSQAFVDSIRVLFEIKATNLPIPIPWPWLVQFGQLSTVEMQRAVTKGIFFIAIFVFGVLGIAWIIRKRLKNNSNSPVLVAAIFLAIPYAHYAYSRADLYHLAPSIPAFLMGILALLANQVARIKWPLVMLLCGTSLFVMLPTHPRWYCSVYSNQACINMKVASDQLMVDRETAGNLVELNKLAKQFSPGDQTFIAAPYWPGAYAALERKAPMWEIFVSSFPRNADFQRAEVERIKAANPGFAVINDYALDGREELRFRNTHPIIDQYIRDNFEPLIDPARPPVFQVYTSKQSGQN